MGKKHDGRTHKPICVVCLKILIMCLQIWVEKNMPQQSWISNIICKLSVYFYLSDCHACQEKENKEQTHIKALQQLLEGLELHLNAWSILNHQNCSIFGQGLEMRHDIAVYTYSAILKVPKTNINWQENHNKNKKHHWRYSAFVGQLMWWCFYPTIVIKGLNYLGSLCMTLCFHAFISCLTNSWWFSG